MTDTARRLEPGEELDAAEALAMDQALLVELSRRPAASTIATPGSPRNGSRMTTSRIGSGATSTRSRGRPTSRA